MKKRIISMAAAAIFTALSVVPFVSVAENQKIGSETELLAEMQKNVQEYMESKGRIKLSQRAANACHFICGTLGTSGIYSEDTIELYVDDDFTKKDDFWYFDVHYDLSASILNVSLNDGVKVSELREYLNENFGENGYKITAQSNMWFVQNFLPDNSEANICIELKNRSELKTTADALVKSGYVASCYVQFGKASWCDVAHNMAPLSFFKPTSGTYVTEGSEGYSDVQDIFNLISSGTIDADFGIVINKRYVDEDIEYNEADLSECHYDWTNFAYIPLTSETDFTKFSDNLIDHISYFNAVPHEISEESQSELMADINDVVPIWTAFFTCLNSGDFLDTGTGYMFDVANTVNGDANCDGEYTIADATAILQSLGNPDKYGLSLQGEFNADIYNVGDGVTPMDALEVQKAMAKYE